MRSSVVSASWPAVAGLNPNHRRVLSNALAYLEELLVKLETVAAGAASGSRFSAYRPDLSPVQQTVVADYLADVRSRMADAIELLGVGPPERTSAAWALHVTLESADIALAEVRSSRLRGYGELDPQAALSVEEYLADLARRLRRLQVYVARGPNADLAARLARLECTAIDLDAVRAVERIITRHGLVELRPTLESLVDRLETRTLEVAVFGRVSSGKSSLLNAVLGTDALPVGVTPVTAVPTRIVFGRAAGATVRFADRPAEEVSLERLAEFVSEERNPGNRRHVSQVIARIPSPALLEGVVFVDTPGMGSLATAGERESYAYLPRCDFGILLIDAAAAPSPQDMEVLRLLHDSGIPGMVVLGKADLLSDAERRRVCDYVGTEMVRRLGLELPVHLVSVTGDASLARDWFARDVAPLCRRVRELSEASVRRKLGHLLESVSATLRVMLGAGGRDGRDASERRRGVEELSAEAEAVLLGARGRVQAVAERLRDTAPEVLTAVASAMAHQWCSNGGGKDAGMAVDRALSEAAERAAAAVQGELVAARERLQVLVSHMAAQFDPASQRRPPEALRLHLLGRPVFEMHRDYPRLEAPRYAGNRHLAGLVERRLRRKLRATCEAAASDALARFASHLQGWAGKALGRLAEELAAQTDPLRAIVRRGAEADGENNDRATVAADLAELESFTTVRLEGASR
jgi:GTP-binding protein EngB required for normal cell division